jgi:phospholipid transport system substrate-binding protein
MIFKTFPGALAIALVSPMAIAQVADPAIVTVQSLDEGLLATMRAGASAGPAGRSRTIAPVIDRTFDLPLMTRLSVGPSWSGFSASDQAALVAAFRALTIASYAKNFDSYSGERFTVLPAVQARGSDRLVRTTLSSPGDAATPIAYRLRQSGSQWKIIDVYYKDSISQLATRRSDFASVLASGGAPALIAHLNRLAAKPR